ncbi:MAG TPA: hypothetical protein VNE62_06805 [Actinomycetota bacterium]|nr:hypothetical protein [Actinomycetota bacterium]
MDNLKFKRHNLPVGDDEISVLVGSDGSIPKTVFMTYDAFLELAATLYTAVDAMKAAGVDPDDLFGDKTPPEVTIEQVDKIRSHLRAVG